MRSLMTLLGGASLGAGGMYLMDPDRGRRRRAELRDALAEVDTGELVERARRLEPAVRQLGGSVGAMLEPARAMLEPARAMLEPPARCWSRLTLEVPFGAAALEHLERDVAQPRLAPAPVGHPAPATGRCWAGWSAPSRPACGWPVAGRPPARESRSSAR